MDISQETVLGIKCYGKDSIVFLILKNYHSKHFFVVSDFGNRPRRLYVVVNPASAEGNALRIWNRVEKLFQLTHITTELMCKYIQLRPLPSTVRGMKWCPD